MKQAHASIALFSFVGLALIPVSIAQTPNPQPRSSNEWQMSRITTQAPAPLKITYGDKSASWTPEQLTAMPQTTVTVYNEHTKANETYTGVPLMDLLAQLGVPATPHGKEMRLYLVAVGSDDYQAVYSVAEVNPSLHDATVIVADTENGKPLAADGPLKLIATREKRPARWVRNLVAIRVASAD